MRTQCGLVGIGIKEVEGESDGSSPVGRPFG